MSNRRTISIWVVLIAVSVALVAADRQARGLVDDVGKLWHNVFNNGFDSIQEATLRQVGTFVKLQNRCQIKVKRVLIEKCSFHGR
jgi:hypothetical protein